METPGRRWVSGWAVVLAALLSGCAGSGSSNNQGGGNGNGGGTNCKTPPPATVHFSTNIQPLFTRSCVFNSCHAGPLPAQQLTLEAGKAYGAIVGVPATEVRKLLVAPGNPGGSYLLTKVDGGLGMVQQQMPIGCPGVPQFGVCFSSDEITALQTWISQCAQNN